MDSLAENFNLAKNHRLSISPRVARPWKNIDELLETFGSSANIEKVDQVDSSGNQSHIEIMEVRDAIYQEASTILKHLKEQEVIRISYLLEENAQNSIHAWKSLRHRQKALSNEVIIPPMKSKSAANRFDREVQKPASIDISKEALDIVAEKSNFSLPDGAKGSQLCSVIKIKNMPHIPRSFCWVPLQVNVIVDDTDVLRALPYFGDNEQADFDASNFRRIPGMLELEVLGEAEEYTVAYIINRHKQLKHIRPEVYSALTKLLGFSVSEVLKAYDRVKDSVWYRETFPDQYTKQEHYTIFNLIKSSAVSNHEALEDLGGREFSFDPDHKDNIINGFGIGLGILNTPDYCKLSQSYRGFFCRKCYSYACHHGVEFVLPRSRVDPSSIFSFPVQGYCLPIEDLRAHRRPVALHGSRTQDLIQLAKSIHQAHPSPQTINRAFPTKSDDAMEVIDLISDEEDAQYSDDNYTRKCVDITEQLSYKDGALYLNDIQMPYSSDSFSFSHFSNYNEESLSSALQNVHGHLNDSGKQKSSVQPAKPSTRSGTLSSKSNQHYTKKWKIATKEVVLMKKLPVHHRLYEADLESNNMNTKKFRSSSVKITDAEQTLLVKLNSVYDHYKAPPQWLANMFEGGKEKLSRSDFLATMLGIRSQKEIVMLTSQLQKDRSSSHQEQGESSAEKNVGNVDDESVVSSDSHASSMSGQNLVRSNTKNSFKYAYEPCDHDGPCELAEDCKCRRNGTFCEKYCGCSVSCKKRFLGCKCKKGGCTTKACPCFAASRACDPDLCGRCASYIPMTMRDAVETCCSKVSHLADNFKLCQNIKYELRGGKKILIKPSKVHGWGAFVAEDCSKNEFIIEYTGEVISQEEAERRGLVYDRLDLSFLFHLNKMQCIDATRRGNNSKFINHSVSLANCEPKVVQVDGDHRVVLIATRNIIAGEELFFNYSYAKHAAPDWAKARAKFSASQQNVPIMKQTEKKL